MNINDTIRANNTVTYYLVADINNNTNSNFQVNFNGGMFKSSNGTVSNFKGETFIT
ncbi:MAG: hypothetical protein LBQ59_05095 [Candidatus Peribacteria bacterium]|jgi:hypothetical protein|nr:hypothetical protein [Candidatus Peribacteria bacterium]